MIRGTPRPTRPRRENDEAERARQAVAYLAGTVGVAIVLAILLFVAHRQGWLDDVQAALRRIELPGLPSAPGATARDALPLLTDNIRNVEQSTTTLWQQGNARSRQ
jgi:hypothetical protein